MTWPANDDMVEHFDLEELTRPDEIPSHFYVSL
jgi:hypothetical protein